MSRLQYGAKARESKKTNYGKRIKIGAKSEETAKE